MSRTESLGANLGPWATESQGLGSPIGSPLVYTQTATGQNLPGRPLSDANRNWQATNACPDEGAFIGQYLYPGCAWTIHGFFGMLLHRCCNWLSAVMDRMNSRYFQTRARFLRASQQRFTDWGEGSNHRRIGAAISEFHDLFVGMSSYYQRLRWMSRPKAGWYRREQLSKDACDRWMGHTP